MTHLLKKILFVLSGITLVTIVVMFNKTHIVNADKKNGKQFGDWKMLCVESQDKTSSICSLIQQLSVTLEDKTQQNVATYQIGHLGLNKELIILQTISTGARVDSGTSIAADDKLIIPGKFITCNSNGCQAAGIVSDNDLQNLLKSKESSVMFFNDQGTKVKIILSTKGLENGLNALKK